MRFEELAEIVADEPVFETGLLLAGAVDPADLRRQLSRWTSSGAFGNCGADCIPWRRHGRNGLRIRSWWRTGW